MKRISLIVMLSLFIITNLTPQKFDIIIKPLSTYKLIEGKEDDILIWYTNYEIDIEYYEVTIIGIDTSIIDRILVDENSNSIKKYTNVYSKPDMVNYYYKVDMVNYNRHIDTTFFLYK